MRLEKDIVNESSKGQKWSWKLYISDTIKGDCRRHSPFFDEAQYIF